MAGTDGKGTKAKEKERIRYYLLIVKIENKMILKRKDYREKAYQYLEIGIDKKALLKQWEIKYLEANEDFYYHLANAIDKINELDIGEDVNIDIDQKQESYIYLRSLFLVHCQKIDKERGENLLGIINTIFNNHFDAPTFSPDVFYKGENLESHLVSIKIYCRQYIKNLITLKSELSEQIFKDNIKQEILDLENKIKEEEKRYYEYIKKHGSYIGGYAEKGKFILFKKRLLNNVLIDTIIKVFPEVENGLNKKEPESTINNKIKKREYKFDELFLSNESRIQTLKAARKLLFISNKDNWIYGKKKGAIMAIIDVLKIRGHLIELSDFEIAKIFAKKFQTTISERTTRNMPNYYRDLVKELKILIE